MKHFFESLVWSYKSKNNLSVLVNTQAWGNAYSGNVKDRERHREPHCLPSTIIWSLSPLRFPTSATNVRWRETEGFERAVNCSSCYVGRWCNEGQCTSSAGCGPGVLVSVDACHCVTGRVRRRRQRLLLYAYNYDSACVVAPKIGSLFIARGCVTLHMCAFTRASCSCSVWIVLVM